MNAGRGSVEVATCIARWIEDEQKEEHHPYVPDTWAQLHGFSDRAFGHIEKYIRRVVNIYDLKGSLLRTGSPSRPYSFQDARSFQLLSTFCEGYFICRDYSGQAMGSVRLMKGQARYTRRMFDLSAVQLPQKYPTIRRLQPGKLQHLQQLLEFIPNVNQPYLQFIIRKQQELDNTEEDDSTEDEDEDHLEYDSDSEDIVDDPQPLQDEDNTGE
ncbi:hypothetical protein O3P69_013934 [Scylla paramamosain]|uniref:SOCS box domain-containing protein n=1 Tax=Scylla paramamosain TaxID=85552 RepID=A0AAW0SSB3_SCYPA